MLWRHLCLVRAWSAAGLLTCSLSLLGSTAWGEPEEAPPQDRTETVKVLDARKAGDLTVDVRGHGQDKVRMTLRNTSAKRLNVLLPPGLVASNFAAQAGGRGGGGFQSMGLGTPTNRPGAFGQFRDGADSAGFHSIPATAGPDMNAVTIPAGTTVELSLPAVCLNFGLPTPTIRDKFHLMDVDDYSADVRVRKALRGLADLGTSHGVAQATMWNVCNSVPFDVMAAQAGKTINPREVELAARFVQAVDSSGATDRVDPAYLTEGRVFVTLQTDGASAKDAERIGADLDGKHVLGLPVRVAERGELPRALGPAVHLIVSLAGNQAGETRGRVTVTRAHLGEGVWEPLGKTTFADGSNLSVLDGAGLARALDHAMAVAFVSVKPLKKGAGSTTLRIDNKLPFTLANVVVRAGDSAGAPIVPLKGLGVGPARGTTAAIEAPTATVERVEINGL
ncbi:MAG: hypothetical protein P4L84_23625 [Isosphaeraceae bacterium]|nr:hypothetical protein [Isosphaeraceae bacterium]